MRALAAAALLICVCLQLALVRASSDDDFLPVDDNGLKANGYISDKSASFGTYKSSSRKAKARISDGGFAGDDGSDSDSGYNAKGYDGVWKSKKRSSAEKSKPFNNFSELNGDYKGSSSKSRGDDDLDDKDLAKFLDKYNIKTREYGSTRSSKNELDSAADDLGSGSDNDNYDLTKASGTSDTSRYAKSDTSRYAKSDTSRYAKSDTNRYAKSDTSRYAKSDKSPADRFSYDGKLQDTKDGYRDDLEAPAQYNGEDDLNSLGNYQKKQQKAYRKYSKVGRGSERRQSAYRGDRKSRRSSSIDYSDERRKLDSGKNLDDDNDLNNLGNSDDVKKPDYSEALKNLGLSDDLNSGDQQNSGYTDDRKSSDYENNLRKPEYSSRLGRRKQVKNSKNRYKTRARIASRDSYPDGSSASDSDDQGLIDSDRSSSRKRKPLPARLAKKPDYWPNEI